MPDTLNRQRGFSLPEVILAMALLVITVTALSGYQRALMTSLVVRAQYQQLWQYGWQQTALYSFSPPESWQEIGRAHV